MTSTKRSHSGIAEEERKALGLPAPKTEGRDVLDVDPARRICRNCGKRVMYVRRSRTKRGHWQHVGDGLVQYRSWGIGR